MEVTTVKSKLNSKLSSRNLKSTFKITYLVEEPMTKIKIQDRQLLRPIITRENRFGNRRCSKDLALRKEQECLIISRLS